MTISSRFAPASVAMLGAFCFAVPAAADVDIETTPVRDYVLPGAFELDGAQVQLGADDTTIISNTTGASIEESRCGILIAGSDDARLIEYGFGGAPTQCVGVTPHPLGGVFVRGSNPLAVEGEVTGFTAFLDSTDAEAWSVTDETLVAANPEPTGTGEFQGAYAGPHPAMSYSPELDKLLGFTIGQLIIGQDVKLISQAHVINVDSGQLRVSGQTFGLSGVGLVGGTTTRASDGHYLIYYYSSGDRGAFFYAYDGRTNIEFFNPRGEDWDDRFIRRMIYTNDLLHLLWTPSDEPTTETRITATTDSSAELWSSTFESEYIFADHRPVNLGEPSTMWVGSEYGAVLHQTPDAGLLLRVFDINGQSPGVAKLEEVGEFPARAIVETADGGLKLLTYDEPNRHVYELAMEFVDVADYDPNKPPPDAGFDGGLPPDVGLDDVLEEVTCCGTIPRPLHAGPWPFALVALGAFVARRRRS